jgi:hypothetical protein
MAKTSDLTGAALDYAVARALGIPAEDLKIPTYRGDSLFRYGRDEEGSLDGTYMTGPDLIFSRKWEAGGPVIEKHKISITVDHSGVWLAYIEYNYADERRFRQAGPTPLVAAMRTFVSSVTGPEVDLPEGLVP